MELQTNREPVVENRIGTWRAFAGIITSPGKTFDRLLEAPRTWLPSLYLGLAGLIFTLPFIGKYSEYFNLLMTKTLAQAPSQTPPTAMLDKGVAIQTVSTVVGAVLSPLISSLIFAFLLKILNLMMGEESKFKQLWTVAVFSQVPILLGLLVKNLLLLSAGGENLLYTFYTGSSLAALVPRTAGTMVISFLSILNVFTIWGLALTSMGTAKAYKAKTAWVALVIFVFYFIFSMGLAYLGQGTLAKILG